MPRNKILNDKNQIIDTALGIIATDGLEAVSMRRLSKEMGVSSMTLYNYVRNVDDIMHEILVRSFNKLYEQIYEFMREMAENGDIGMKAYAKAYALALYDFALKQTDICEYLIGQGKITFCHDAELRPFYDIFGIFLLNQAAGDGREQLKQICCLYEGAVTALIHGHTTGVQPLSREDLTRMVDLFVEKMFPTNESE